MRSGDARTDLYIETRRGGVRLIVRDERDARQRPRREEEARLDIAALEKLLQTAD